MKKRKLDTKNVLNVDEQSGTSKALIELKNMTISRDIGNQKNDKSFENNNDSIDKIRYKKDEDGNETTIETREYLCFKNYLWRDYQASAHFNRGMMTQNETQIHTCPHGCNIIFCILSSHTVYVGSVDLSTSSFS